MEFEDRPYFNESSKAAMATISSLVEKKNLIADVFPGLGETVCFFSLVEEPEVLFKLSIERWR